MQPDIDSIRRAICQRQVMARWLSHSRPVYAINLLQEADNDVGKLSQCKLLADADSRSAIEWEIVPARAATLPSLWTELVRVFSPEVLSTVHNVNLISRVSSMLFFLQTCQREPYAIANILPLFHVYWRLSIRSSSRGESGICHCSSDVERDDGIQSQAFINAPLKILTALHLLKSNVLWILVRAEFVHNNASQLGKDALVLRVRHGEEEPPQCRRSCVATS